MDENFKTNDYFAIKWVVLLRWNVLERNYRGTSVKFAFFYKNFKRVDCWIIFKTIKCSGVEGVHVWQAITFLPEWSFIFNLRIIFIITKNRKVKKYFNKMAWHRFCTAVTGFWMFNNQILKTVKVSTEQNPLLVLNTFRFVRHVSSFLYKLVMNL